MRKLILLGLLTIILLSAVPSGAARLEGELAQWPEGSSAHTSISAEIEFKKHDEKLNEIYKKLTKADFVNTSQETGRKVLVEAQRAWISFRDQNCKMVGELDGGVANWKSAKEMVCRAEVTRNRVKELEVLFAQVTE